jgi:hypothetical protein
MHSGGLWRLGRQQLVGLQYAESAVAAHARHDGAPRRHADAWCSRRKLAHGRVDDAADGRLNDAADARRESDGGRVPYDRHADIARWR